MPDQALDAPTNRARSTDASKAISTGSSVQGTARPSDAAIRTLRDRAAGADFQARLKKIHVRQLRLGREDGVIDQDTGQCFLASKLMLLNAAGIIDPAITIGDALDALYVRPAKRDGDARTDAVVGTLEYTSATTGKRIVLRSKTDPETRLMQYIGFGPKVKEGAPREIRYPHPQPADRMRTGSDFQFTPEMEDGMSKKMAWADTLECMAPLVDVLRDNLAEGRVRPTTDVKFPRVNEAHLRAETYYVGFESKHTPAARHGDHYRALYCLGRLRGEPRAVAYYLDPFDGTIRLEPLMSKKYWELKVRLG